MNDHNMAILLDQARRTIEGQRRTIGELTPKAHAYDTIAAAVRLNAPREGGAFEPDIAWELGQAAEALVAKATRRPTAADATMDEVKVARRKPGPKPAATKASGDLTASPRPRRRGAKA